MICNNCKKENPINNNFCSTCGTKLFNDTNNKPPKKIKNGVKIIIVNFILLTLGAHAIFSLICNIIIKMVPPTQGTPNNIVNYLWKDITTSFFATGIIGFSWLAFNIYNIIKYIKNKKTNISKEK